MYSTLRLILFLFGLWYPDLHRSCRGFHTLWEEHLLQSSSSGLKSKWSFRVELVNGLASALRHPICGGDTNTDRTERKNRFIPIDLRLLNHLSPSTHALLEIKPWCNYCRLLLLVTPVLDYMHKTAQIPCCKNVKHFFFHAKWSFCAFLSSIAREVLAFRLVDVTSSYTYKRISAHYIYEIQDAFRTTLNSQPFVFKSYILFDGSKAWEILFVSVHFIWQL